MIEFGKIIFGVFSLIMMYNILEIELPIFLKELKNNQTIINIFSFYYVYDLTTNIFVSLLSVLIIEVSRKYDTYISKKFVEYKKLFIDFMKEYSSNTV